MKNNSMQTNMVSVVIIISILIGLSYYIYGAFIYRDEIGITIEDRYWTWFKSYTYTVTTYTQGCETTYTKDAKGNIISSETTCGMTPTTNTYTRCKATSSGKTLPENKPAMSCSPQTGDIETNTVSHIVVYHKWETDKQVTSKIKRNSWDEFAPGESMTVKVNLFGGIIQ